MRSFSSLKQRHSSAPADVAAADAGRSRVESSRRAWGSCRSLPELRPAPRARSRRASCHRVAIAEVDDRRHRWSPARGGPPLSNLDEDLTPAALGRRERQHSSVRRNRRKLLETDEVRHVPDAMNRRRRQPDISCAATNAPSAAAAASATRPAPVRSATTRALSTAGGVDAAGFRRPILQIEKQVPEVLKPLLRLFLEAVADDAFERRNPGGSSVAVPLVRRAGWR